MHLRRASASLILGTLALLLFSTVARADESAEWIARADSLQLGTAPQWLRLLHHEPGWFGSKSRAAPSAFFQSPEGHEDPKAELDAVLQAFFDPSPGTSEKPHAVCRFPARRAWLESRLDGLAAALPQRPCPAFDQFHAQVGATGASLVFSSYYLETPASAFGHTLLRLHRTEARDGTDLLDFGINYAANVDTSNALVYGIKGLLGLFAGQLTAQPYYYKVREYNDYESRDLWEYELDLTPDELEALVAHVWELGSARFSYWYTSENCSYFMLALLEAAVPRWELLAQLPPWTVPVDTVKALTLTESAVREVRYRPSAREVLAARAATLTGRELRLALDLRDDVDAPLAASLAPERHAAILDTALDAFDVRHAQAVLVALDPAIEQRRRVLLNKRSAIAVRSPSMKLTPPEGKRPDAMLGSQRFELGFGWSRTNRWFVPVGYRTALHDFVESSRGFGALARIEFLSTSLRLGPGQTGIERLSVVRAGSFVPWTSLQKRASWTFDVGARGSPAWNCPTCVVGHVAFGSGFTFATRGHGATLVLLATTSLEGGPSIDGRWDLPLRLNLTPTATVRLERGRFTFALAGGYDLRLESRMQGLPLAESELRVVVVPSLSLVARATASPRALETSLGVSLYR